jgi:hypothetical protein
MQLSDFVWRDLGLPIICDLHTGDLVSDGQLIPRCYSC